MEEKEILYIYSYTAKVYNNIIVGIADTTNDHLADAKTNDRPSPRGERTDKNTYVLLCREYGCEEWWNASSVTYDDTFNLW